MANKRRSTDIIDATTEVADALQHLSNLFAKRGLPRTQAGKAVQFDTREGWIVSPTMMYTLAQTSENKRHLPEGYAG